MTAMMTTSPGISSHGIRINERMFCADYSRTPQLTIGSRMPSPRKLSAVSAMMM